MKRILVFSILTAILNVYAAPVLASIDMNSEPIPQPNILRVEQSSVKRSPVKTVYITDNSIIIKHGNILKVSFAEQFSTKNAEAGDLIEFVFDEDFKTLEETVLLPAGTQINARVTGVVPSKYWGKNAEAYIELTEIILPSGQRGEIKAKVYSKDASLKRPTWLTWGRTAGCTIGLFGAGSGIGAIVGAIAGSVGTACCALGMPIGGGVGLNLASALKGLNYTAKKGAKLELQLKEDFEIILKKDENI